MDPVHDRGSMDLVQSVGPWTPGPCFVLTHTTASSEVVNHASTVNVFGCKNSQFQLPQNFISQIDRGSIALSLEYHFSNESHVPRRDFRC